MLLLGGLKFNRSIGGGMSFKASGPTEVWGATPPTPEDFEGVATYSEGGAFGGVHIKTDKGDFDASLAAAKSMLTFFGSSQEPAVGFVFDAEMSDGSRGMGVRGKGLVGEAILLDSTSKVLGNFNKSRGPRRDCSYRNAAGVYYDCHSCIKRFFDQGLVGTGDGDGSVFVPTGRGSIGRLRGATGFFVDLERVTAWAQEGGARDFDQVAKYGELFGLDPSVLSVPSEGVKAVLRSATAVDVSQAVEDVSDALGTSAAELREAVGAHVEERRDSAVLMVSRADALLGIRSAGVGVALQDDASGRRAEKREQDL